MCIRDRVQNLLKITRLDAGSVVLEKKNENVAEMVQDIARQYHYLSLIHISGADRPLPEHPACNRHPARQRTEAG